MVIDSMAHLNTRDRGRNVRAICAGHAVNRPRSLHLRTVQMRRIQITQGDRYGRLTILREVTPSITPTGRVWRRVECRCECGTTTTVRLNSLRTKHTVSCGCIRRDVATKHAQCGTLVYSTWANMLTRCRNSSSPDYDQYGGRGITVCDRWLTFGSFFADMGPRPSAKHSIDRKDNNGNYEPGNCWWATPTQQNRNRRNNHLVTLNGETLCGAECVERTELSESAIRFRLNAGWTVEQALTLPLRKDKRRLKEAERILTEGVNS